MIYYVSPIQTSCPTLIARKEVKSRFFMNKKVIEKVKTAESTISMILGVVVVVVAGIILFNYFKGFIKKQSEKESETTKQLQEEMFNEEVEEGTPAFNGELPTKYAVEKGDSLWKISIKFYGYGYNWVDISKENNLLNPEQIEVGQELNIPNVEVRKPVVFQVSDIQVANPIEGNNISHIEENKKNINNKNGGKFWRW